MEHGSILIITSGEQSKRGMTAAIAEADLVIKDGQIIKNRFGAVDAPKPITFVAGDLVLDSTGNRRIVVGGWIARPLNEEYGVCPTTHTRISDGNNTWVVSTAKLTRVGHVSDKA